MSQQSNNHHGSNRIIIVLMIVCFAAAGILGFLFFDELNNRNQAGSTNQNVQQIAVQTAAPMATATITASPQATAEINNEGPIQSTVVTSGETSAPTQTAAAMVKITAVPEAEPEDEIVDDDSELEAFMYAEQEGLLNAIPTPQITPGISIAAQNVISDDSIELITDNPIAAENSPVSPSADTQTDISAVEPTPKPTSGNRADEASHSTITPENISSDLTEPAADQTEIIEKQTETVTTEIPQSADSSGKNETEAPASSIPKQDESVSEKPANPTTGSNSSPKVTALAEITPSPVGIQQADTPNETVTPDAGINPSATVTPCTSITDIIITGEAADTTEVTPGPAQDPTDTATPAATPVSSPVATPVVGSSVESDIRYKVDFNVLSTVNDEVCGWLMQEGTSINYPIAQHSDNDYYINHLFDKKTNKAGCIYMDCGNTRYFGDGITYLYGHNRNDDTMFASIPKYKNIEYWREHPTMLLMTPYQDYQVEIFACVRRSINTSDEWRTRGYSSRAEFDGAMDAILSESFIDTGVMPRWGDQLLALCTCTNEVSTQRYIVYARLRPIVYTTADAQAIEKQEMDSKTGTSRVINVPVRGETMYYAQNDPVWAGMWYASKNSSNRGTMSSSGCAPTSMAMIITNMVEPQNYWWINYYSGLDTGLLFCSHSVNQFFCDHSHAQYRLSTAEEFSRYMPVAVASYATGNNVRKIKSRGTGKGTSTVLFGQLAKDYGFEMTVSKHREVLLANLYSGGMSIVSTGGAGTPYTGGGHFMVAAAADEEYIYLLDPLMKESYKATDKHHLIEVIEPGLIRVRIADWRSLALYTSYNFVMKYKSN